MRIMEEIEELGTERKYLLFSDSARARAFGEGGIEVELGRLQSDADTGVSSSGPPPPPLICSTIGILAPPVKLKMDIKLTSWIVVTPERVPFAQTVFVGDISVIFQRESNIKNTADIVSSQAL